MWFVVVQSLSCVWFFVTPWTAAPRFPVLHHLPELAQNSCILSRERWLSSCPFMWFIWLSVDRILSLLLSRALPIPGTCLPKNSLTQELPLLGAQVSPLHHKAFSVSFVSSCLCFLQRQTSLESVLAKMPCLCVRAQSYKTVCNPMDCSLSGSSIYRIFQARILEWVVISFSREFFWSKDRTCTLASPALVGRKGLASWEANKMP